MKSDAIFDPKLPVKMLLERSPVVRPVLASYGLDTCCGGEHPLEEACAAKGVSLAEVLEDLESAHGVAEANNLVPPTMSIREVRRRFPSTHPVFERYGLGRLTHDGRLMGGHGGMMGCCGEAGMGMGREWEWERACRWTAR